MGAGCPPSPWIRPWFIDEVMIISALYSLDCYSGISLKQHSTSRHFVPHRHTILIQSQSFFGLIPKCIELMWRIPIIYFFGLTWPGIVPTIYSIRGMYANTSKIKPTNSFVTVLEESQVTITLLKCTLKHFIH